MLENGLIRKLVPDLFFKELNLRLKQVVSTLVLRYFGRPPLRHAIITDCIKFQTVDTEIWPI